MRPKQVAPTDIVDLTFDDIDEAREIGTQLYYPQRLIALDRRSNVSMSVRAGRIGPFLLGELSYNTDIRIDCDELETSYHVNLPLEGRLVTSHRGHDVVATPDLAAVYGPVGTTALPRWEAHSRHLCVKIDRLAMESAMSAWLGLEITTPVTFDPVLDLRSSAGRGWAGLAIMIGDQLHRPGSLVYQPLTAASLVDSLLNGLFCAVRHEFSEALARGDGACRSPIVQKAIDYIHTRAAEPITTRDIAAHCCISVRALQEGFVRHVGRSPMQYLRAVRLRRAHEELLAADPREETVSRVAHRWGFTNPGRFATAHEIRFGEPPSHALRRSG